MLNRSTRRPRVTRAEIAVAVLFLLAMVWLVLMALAVGS